MIFLISHFLLFSYEYSSSQTGRLLITTTTNCSASRDMASSILGDYMAMPSCNMAIPCSQSSLTTPLPSIGRDDRDNYGENKLPREVWNLLHKQQASITELKNEVMNLAFQLSSSHQQQTVDCSNKSGEGTEGISLHKLEIRLLEAQVRLERLKFEELETQLQKAQGEVRKLNDKLTDEAHEEKDETEAVALHEAEEESTKDHEDDDHDKGENYGVILLEDLYASATRERDSFAKMIAGEMGEEADLYQEHDEEQSVEAIIYNNAYYQTPDTGQQEQDKESDDDDEEQLLVEASHAYYDRSLGEENYVDDNGEGSHDGGYDEENQNFGSVVLQDLFASATRERDSLGGGLQIVKGLMGEEQVVPQDDEHETLLPEVMTCGGENYSQRESMYPRQHDQANNLVIKHAPPKNLLSEEDALSPMNTSTATADTAMNTSGILSEDEDHDHDSENQNFGVIVLEDLFVSASKEHDKVAASSGGLIATDDNVPEGSSFYLTGDKVEGSKQKAGSYETIREDQDHRCASFYMYYGVGKNYNDGEKDSAAVAATNEDNTTTLTTSLMPKKPIKEDEEDFLSATGELSLFRETDDKGKYIYARGKYHRISGSSKSRRSIGKSKKTLEPDKETSINSSSLLSSSFVRETDDNERYIYARGKYYRISESSKSRRSIGKSKSTFELDEETSIDSSSLFVCKTDDNERYIYARGKYHRIRGGRIG